MTYIQGNIYRTHIYILNMHLYEIFEIASVKIIYHSTSNNQNQHSFQVSFLKTYEKI